MVPVPKQFTQSDRTKVPVLDFIRENWLSRAPNPEVYHKITILKSRSISEDEHHTFWIPWKNQKWYLKHGIHEYG